MGELTGDVLTRNSAPDWPSGIVTPPATCAAALFDVSEMERPVGGAGSFTSIRPVMVWPPVTAPTVTVINGVFTLPPVSPPPPVRSPSSEIPMTVSTVFRPSRASTLTSEPEQALTRLTGKLALLVPGCRTTAAGTETHESVALRVICTSWSTGQCNRT